MAYTQVVNRTVLGCLLLLLPAMLAAQQWRTSLEISHPAALRLPDGVQQVMLVNNTVAHPDAPRGAFFTLMAASEMLEGSDYVPSVLETSQNRSASIYVKQLLSNERADSLMQTYESDALLVLNQEIVHPTLDSYATDNDTYYAYIQGIVATHWTLFYRDEGLRARTLIFTDTLYWENEAASLEAAVGALPEMEDVQYELFVYAGEHLAQRLMPRIETVDRYVYDLGKDDAGMQYFVRQQWQEAIHAWTAPKDKKRLDAYAAANCALASEIIGDLPVACSYAERAIALFDALRGADDRQQAANMRYYLELLQARMAE